MPWPRRSSLQLRNPRDHELVTERINAPALVEHLFRHEYGRLVASLVRRVGVQHLQLVEDAVQSALMAALATWDVTAAPNDGGAWLFKVAYNHVIQDLRRESGRLRLLGRFAEDLVEGRDGSREPYTDNEIRDDVLRMLFVCCDGLVRRSLNGISLESTTSEA